jgi:5'-nucleotidase
MKCRQIFELFVCPDYHDDRFQPKKWAICAQVFALKTKSLSMKHTKSLLALLLILCACATQSISSPTASPPTLSIIHLNDTYRVGDVEEGRRGGYGRIATLVRNLQAEGRTVRITHGGDFLFPSLESQLWNGEQMVEALNFLNNLAPVYLVPGNHEFDRRTPDAIISAVGKSEFRWLGDNLILQTGDATVDSAVEDAFIFTAGGRVFGIFALALLARDGGNSREYVRIEGEYIDVAENTIQELERAGAEIIFGITHLYLEDDIALAGLKKRHPSFMFIVGGHDHEPEFEEGSADSAAIMKGASNARTIWQIDIAFDGDVPLISTYEIAVDESISVDAEYQVIADKWRDRLLRKMPFLPSQVGIAAVPLDGREATLRNVESNWANFIVDQMPGAFGEPAADFAFINSGTLRIDDFVTDDITFEDIGRTFGFSSYLNHMTINGGDFVTLLEAGYRGYGPSKGYFPQVSGFRVCIDRSQPDGQRIVQMQVPGDKGWQDIDRNKDYTLVASDFIFRGGDGYDFSKVRDVSRPGSELKYRVLDAILVAQAKGEKIGKPVDPDNPRISMLPKGVDHCFL